MRLGRIGGAAILFAGQFLTHAFGAVIPTGTGTIAFNPTGGVVCIETTAAQADTGGGCTGFITSITLANGTIMTLTVGSDSEGHFDPFGFGADTTDGINFSFNQGNTTVTNLSQAGSWTRFMVDGTTPIPSGSGPTYVLPSDLTPIGCGTENEPICEPLGIFVLNTPIVGTGGGVTFTITNAQGVVSDSVRIFNSAANGNGVITFLSDVPEPSTFMLGGAALALACFARRRVRIQ